MSMQEQAKQMIEWYERNEPAMRDAAEGKPIQFKCSEGWTTGDKWLIVSPRSEFRLVPEPKYRPFTRQEMEQVVGEVLVHKEGWRFQPNFVRSNNCVQAGEVVYFPDDLLRLFTFERDGSPCGVKE